MLGACALLEALHSAVLLNLHYLLATQLIIYTKRSLSNFLRQQIKFLYSLRLETMIWKKSIYSDDTWSPVEMGASFKCDYIYSTSLTI